MTYNEFLNEIIRRGKAGATKDYGRSKSPNAPMMLKGALAGFDACSELKPTQLVQLLLSSHKRTNYARYSRAEDYWYHNCFEAEVNWVCNVVSAALWNSGQPGITSPTARGLQMAADILGIKPMDIQLEDDK